MVTSTTRGLTMKLVPKPIFESLPSEALAVSE